MDDISEYFEKDVFTEKKDTLGKAGRYYKDLCGEHGRIEKREYYVENDIGWLKDRHPEWKELSGIGACVLTIQDVCDTLKVGRNRVYKMPANGELKGWRIGHVWKITQSSLQEYLKTCGYTYNKTDKI